MGLFKIFASASPSIGGHIILRTSEWVCLPSLVSCYNNVRLGGTDLAMNIIEGSWEEIERRKAELIGYRLRVTILREKSTTLTPSKPQK
jgi:hypothetical protein